MRPVNKDIFEENQDTYNPYGDAKDDLILALGNFCSYCERQGYSSALDVEHINDKDTHPDQKYNWNNFLLACKNCNPIKGTKLIENSLLPHIDNTYIVFSYLESGFISTDNPLAQKLIDLVGLDRVPGHPNYSKKDKRWEERKQAWEIASRYSTKYQAGQCDIEIIKDLALKSGFWSIWMNEFQNFIEVQQELIISFNGTHTEYFE